MTIKDLIVGSFSSGPLARWIVERDGGRFAIIMMHRFAVHGRQQGGHAVADLRNGLALMRKSGVRLLGLDTAVDLIDQDQTLGRHTHTSIIFTVDDGYADFADVALPVFQEFDCPVTVFVAPGVVSGHTWYWWDKLDYCIRQSQLSSITVDTPHGRKILQITGEANLKQAMGVMNAMLRQSSPDESEQHLAQLAAACEVELPRCAPDGYHYLSWQDMRKLESEVVRFGAHSMTHPMLSLCSDQQSEAEITESLVQVRKELQYPSGVFCYPVGTRKDFGEREMRIAKEAGASAALAAEPGLIDSNMNLRYGANWKYQLPRMSFDARRGALIRQFL